jgi:hypothetical protein
VTKLSNSMTMLACVGLMFVAYLGVAVRAPAAQPNGTPPASTASPVVLELYQSQGCSSCPPALAVLNGVANRPDVLALNFAVTYWDQLGWKDSFAKPAFTARQWDYARAGGRGNVQTPQLIVDGRTAILGSRKSEVDAAIAGHRSVPGAPAIISSGAAITISDGRTSSRATIWLVEYDPRTIPISIRAGENGGRTLGHRNIVKRMTAIGAWAGKNVTLALPPEQSGLARAILFQSGAGGPIMAAQKI